MKDSPRATAMVMTALLITRPNKREELHQALCSLLAGIRDQPGCLECMASQDLGGDPRFHLHLVWQDRESLEAFMAADVFRILMGAVNVLADPTAFRIVSAEDTCLPGELKSPGSRRKPRSRAALPGPP